MSHADDERDQTPQRREVDLAELEELARPPRSEEDFAVVVGIDDYPYFRSLRGAANDARSFHEWLCDPRGGGLAAGNAKLILSDPQAKTPVQDEIDRTLVEVLDAASACGGARRLYFYFSGHGAMNADRSGDDTLLMLARWSTSLGRLALSTDRYSSKLCGYQLFQELAIFVDCCRCHSESAIGIEPTITKMWRSLCPTEKLIAYATEAGHPACECPEPPKHIAWQGIFTRCLLSILRGSPDGVSARELKDRLPVEVEREAQRKGICQRARVYSGLDSSRFGRGGEWPLLTLKLTKRRGTVVLRGNEGIVHTFEVGKPPRWFGWMRPRNPTETWQRRLPAGLYQIEGGGQPPVPFQHDGREVVHEL